MTLSKTLVRPSSNWHCMRLLYIPISYSYTVPTPLEPIWRWQLLPVSRWEVIKGTSHSGACCLDIAQMQPVDLAQARSSNHCACPDMHQILWLFEFEVDWFGADFDMCSTHNAWQNNELTALGWTTCFLFFFYNKLFKKKQIQKLLLNMLSKWF